MGMEMVGVGVGLGKEGGGFCDGVCVSWGTAVCILPWLMVSSSSVSPSELVGEGILLSVARTAGGKVPKAARVVGEGALDCWRDRTGVLGLLNPFFCSVYSFQDRRVPLGCVSWKMYLNLLFSQITRRAFHFSSWNQ